jgi:hypothetical protein
MKKFFLCLMLTVISSVASSSECGQLGRDACFAEAFRLHELGGAQNELRAKKLFSEVCKLGREDACSMSSASGGDLKIISFPENSMPKPKAEEAVRPVQKIFNDPEGCKKLSSQDPMNEYTGLASMRVKFTEDKKRGIVLDVPPKTFWYEVGIQKGDILEYDEVMHIATGGALPLDSHVNRRQSLPPSVKRLTINRDTTVHLVQIECPKK